MSERMIVANGVKHVEFCLTEKANWYIKINGKPIRRYDRYWKMNVLVDFLRLDSAIRYAKDKCIIPQNFDMKSIQQELIVEIG
jgi:hypothetical protein